MLPWSNRICDAVGGLPLGIELASAVERSLAEIDAGIRESSEFLASSRPDLPSRQKSLAETIDWSIRLLDDDEGRSLLFQLSVAPGDLDDEAIRDIAVIHGNTRRIHELLSGLVGAKLLVRRERGGRSTYRETVEVRRRCRERRLSARGEVEGGAWSRFAATFLVRAESAYNRRYGADVRQGLDALERDYDNLLSVATISEPTDPTIAAKVALYLA